MNNIKLAKVTDGTVYHMRFDFNSAEQRAVLSELQKNGYTLIAYKGAKGPNQVSAGLPTWFAIPFGNIFGEVDIQYAPKYKVYVFNQAEIAANTTIQMQSLSGEVSLGTGLNFTQDGAFTDAGSSDPGTITLHNLRPAGTPAVTVGLAGLVSTPAGAQFLPFCAFTMPPMGSIRMEPIEQVAIMAARVNLQSGNVQANAAAPGATLVFSSATVNYDLMVQPSTYQITNQPGTTPVTPLSSGQSLDYLNQG